MQKCTRILILPFPSADLAASDTPQVITTENSFFYPLLIADPWLAHDNPFATAMREIACKTHVIDRQPWWLSAELFSCTLSHFLKWTDSHKVCIWQEVLTSARYSVSHDTTAEDNRERAGNGIKFPPRCIKPSYHRTVTGLFIVVCTSKTDVAQWPNTRVIRESSHCNTHGSSRNVHLHPLGTI